MHNTNTHTTFVVLSPFLVPAPGLQIIVQVFNQLSNLNKHGVSTSQRHCQLTNSSGGCEKCGLGTRLGLMCLSVLCHTTPVRPDEGHYKRFHQGSYPYSQAVTSEDVLNTAMFSDYRGCHVYLGN